MDRSDATRMANRTVPGKGKQGIESVYVCVTGGKGEMSEGEKDSIRWSDPEIHVRPVQPT